MACACTRRKRGARGHAGRLVSGGVGEIAAPVAGRGSSPRGGVSPAPSGCSSVRCSAETSVGCSSGEGAAWRQPAVTAGVRAGARIRAQSPRPVGTAATARARRCRGGRPLDAKRRRLPHWGCEMRRRAHPARKEPATWRPVRWPTKRHCGKRAAETVPVRMTGGCHQAAATGNARKACHTCAGWYLRSTPCGRPVPDRYGVRMHAPRVRARGRVVWQPSTRSGAAAAGG